MREIRFPGHLVNSILMCFCPTGEGRRRGGGEDCTLPRGFSIAVPRISDSPAGGRNDAAYVSLLRVLHARYKRVYTRDIDPRRSFPTSVPPLSATYVARPTQFTVVSPDTCVFFNGAKTWPATFLILHPPVCLLHEFRGTHDRPTACSPFLFYSLLACSTRLFFLFLFPFDSHIRSFLPSVASTFRTSYCEFRIIDDTRNSRSITFYYLLIFSI